MENCGESMRRTEKTDLLAGRKRVEEEVSVVPSWYINTYIYFRQVSVVFE